ncbi:MAG: hypothetical protein ACREDT_10525 [Methylocella sp.]
MRNDHGLQGAGAPLRHVRHEMTVTEQGLLLGDGTLLAKMEGDGLCLEGEEERILTLLAVAYGRNIPAATLGSFRRASKHWQSGDKCLAAIHLAQNGLGKLDAAGAYRLSLAAKLIEVGMTPRELARELGLRLPADLIKYDPDQPRVPAGSGRESGQWTSGDAAAGGDASVLTEGRSAATVSDKVHVVYDLPKDAIVVTRPEDGTAIEDQYSLNGKLMAPPRADFREAYAAGEKIANWPIAERIAAGHAALAQWGTYDYQRDKATNTYFEEYADAANYAVGVFMAGAGYGKWESVAIAQGWGFFTSSNKYSERAKYWTKRGWDDADQGIWR